MGKKQEDEVQGNEERLRSTLRVMNERFKTQLDENVFEGVRDDSIYHGLKLTLSTAMHKVVTDMCFCAKSKEYYLLERGVEVHRYSMQGKLLLPSYTLDPAYTFARMLWCDEADRLVCYDTADENIWVLNRTCSSLVRPVVKNEFRTGALYYEPKTNEVIMVGAKQAAKYPLEDKDEDLEIVVKSVNYSDPEFGPSWQIESSSIIPESTSPALLVVSYKTTLYLMPLEVDAASEDFDDNVEFLGKHLNASKAPITAIHYILSSQWIVTGDQQGNVMAWTMKFECLMTHNGAHATSIEMFVSHPSICGFLSCANVGESGVLQVWSCNFRDKIEVFTELGHIRALSSNESAATLVVLGSRLNYLTMHQTYCFFAPLTAPVKHLQATQNPMYSTKIVAASTDNSVRLFSSYGRQLNVQILPQETLHVVSALYSGIRNQLFTIILKTGEILVSDTSVRPMKFRNVFVNDGPPITCLTMYEYFDEIRDKDRRSKKPRIFYPINICIIVGTVNGNLIVINANTGKHENVVLAHRQSVMQLESSTKGKHVVSLGIDRCVKVWRFFANLSQPLAIYYTLYFTTPITRIFSMGEVLCMVNSSMTSTVHEVFMEDMVEKLRLEHHNSKDHTGPIVDMVTSETLELCATSSLDGTIRIWDRQNVLVKILVINTCAWNMVFSSVRCDIVFCAGRHLYKIPYENYLSPKYRAKIVANDIPEEENEKCVPENLELRVYDDVVDRNLMLHPVVSTPLASIDITSSDKPRVDILIRKQICALYEYRDEDLRLIKENLLKPLKVMSSRALMTIDVWEKYVNDLLESMTRPAPDVPEYNYHKIREENSEIKKGYNERGVFHMLFGYSVDELEETENLPELIRGSRLPLNGFLPNSVLYKIREEVVEEPVYVEPVVRKRVKYEYPAPKEDDDSSGNVSLSLSALLGGDDRDKDEKEEA